MKPLGTYNTREDVISASKSAFVPNKLTERSCNQKQTLDYPSLSAPMDKTTARTVTKLWTWNNWNWVLSIVDAPAYQMIISQTLSLETWF